MAEVASRPVQPAGTPNGSAAGAAMAAQFGTPSSALQGRPADALDSPDFDAVQFLNEMFPTGELFRHLKANVAPQLLLHGSTAPLFDGRIWCPLRSPQPPPDVPLLDI